MIKLFIVLALTASAILLVDNSNLASSALADRSVTPPGGITPTPGG